MTEIPKNAPKPQDHKKPKKSARQAEADGDEYIVLEMCGVEIEIPRDQNEWPFSATRAFVKKNPTLGVIELLGEEACDELEKAGAKNRDFGALAEQLEEALGTGGN